VDADEEVSPALKDEILSTLARAENCSGYYIPITTMLWDQVVRKSGRHTKLKLRLFDRRFGNFRNQLVHESVSVEGRTRRLREPMYNHSFTSIADYFDKFNRYSTLAALESFRPAGKKPSFLKAVVALPLTFIQFYFLQGFIWDGAAGFTWSLFSAFYPTVRYFKLSEFHRAYARQQLDENLLAARSNGAEEQLQSAAQRSAPRLAGEFVGAPSSLEEHAGRG